MNIKLLFILYLFSFFGGLQNVYSLKLKSSFNVLDKIYKPRASVSLRHLLSEYKMTNDFIKMISKIIISESKKYYMDPIFIASMILAESSFRVYAKSSAGAIGLMQVLPNTGKMVADKIGIKLTKDSDLYDPRINIKIGIWYINELLKLYKDPLVAITAYNFGPGNVNKMLKKYASFPKYPYLIKIVSFYNKFLRRVSIIQSVASSDLVKSRKKDYKAMNL